MEAIQRLTKDLKNVAKTLTDSEARYLVDAYYSIQEYRKSTGNQIRAMSESEEPSEVIQWLFANMQTLEVQIKRALDAYTDAFLLGKWCKSIPGIGPVITAGLMAHIDATKPHVSHIWNFAGLNPAQEWKKGEKRPWNARLLTLCWKIGESFIKVRNNPEDVYGKLYWQRKLLEWRRNLAGELEDQAKTKLEKFKIRKTTDAYLWYSGRLMPKEGVTAEGMRETKNHLEHCVRVSEGWGVQMLPPAHISQRAKRYAVKIFLSHYHQVAYEIEFGERPAKPYVIEHLGHADFMEPPNWPMSHDLR